MSGPRFIAASGGDTVKLFDVSGESTQPCALSYTPSPGFVVNSVKWNHTNLVVASAGDDKKVTLWRSNGQSLGTIPLSGTDSGDNIEEAISSINFSNKGSRYLCSGGSGQVVRIWDLQRKRCIKWLKGHTSTITGVMYNCKDEHLASISLNGDLILHNLASGAKTAELKDPAKQVLRVLDYSRVSRHLLVTAGDDGSVHLWDTTGRNPKVSWAKQHSAPTAGVCFSPSNDKIIASVGLDKKLYTFDSGTKKQTSFFAHDAPFSSLAFRDDGWILAAGTINGRVVFYDVRGKPEPFTVLRAYGTSEAVSSLCWQRSKPVYIDDRDCTDETALLGGAVEESILMPDPLPSSTSSNLSQTMALSGPQGSGPPGSSAEASFPIGAGSGPLTSPFNSSTVGVTPQRNSLWTGGALSRLHATRTYSFKDEMEVFSPLVDAQPVTPSLEKLWNEKDVKREQAAEKNSSLFLTSKRFPLSEEAGTDAHPIFDWKSKSTSKQDDILSFPQTGSTLAPLSKTDDLSPITPPEAWGVDRLSDKFLHHRQIGSLPPRFSMLTSGELTSAGLHSGLQDSSSLASQGSTTSLGSSSLGFLHSRPKELSPIQETSIGYLGHVPFSSIHMPVGASKSLSAPSSQTSLDSTSLPASISMARRFSTYAERISTTPAFADGTSVSSPSPKTKKTGAETREELLNCLLLRSDASSASESGSFPSTNGTLTQPQRTLNQSDGQPGSSSFTLQLFQRTLEETLGTFQKTIHEDVRNLHIEILRQFHMQEIEMSSLMNTMLDNQTELMKEVQALRKENQQLRQLL